METFNKALFIVQTLQEAGYTAYFAGGWVRDHLLNHPSDDIDIATNATPETIQALFEKTIPVGIQFGIIIVRIDRTEFEVATFRKDIEYKDGRRPSRVEFTEAKEDALRRDYTINGLFYDPVKKQLFDYIEGKMDLEHKLIRAIGNPHQRISEDRLRMMRAIRYATRFSFTIEKKTKEAILTHANELLPAVAIERVVQELKKMHAYNTLRPSLLMLHQYNLFQSIFKEHSQICYETLEKILRPLNYFPEHSPLIAGLVLLLNPISKENIIDFCKRFKLSKHETEYALFFEKSLSFIKKPQEAREWAYFYANPFSKIALEVNAALHPESKNDFIEEHVKRQKTLSTHINRILTNTPLLQSNDLIKEGITPGPHLGKLLKEGERFAINQDLDSKEGVIEKLKLTPLWKKK